MKNSSKTPARSLTALELCVTNSLDLRPRTKVLYLESLARWHAFAGTEPAGWRFEVVLDWLQALLASGLKPQTVRNHRKAVRYASQQYAERTRIQANDFALNAGNKIKALPPKKKTVLDVRELDAVLATCHTAALADLRDYTLLLVAARTALRRGGLAALDWEGVTPPTLTTSQKGGGTITFDAGTEALAALAGWRAAVAAQGITTGAVFRRIKRGRLGERLSPFQIWEVFRDRAKQAGIRHIYPHLFRHSTITWLRELKVPAADVRRMTGQTEKTIEDIYTHMRTREPVADVLPPSTVRPPGEKP